MSTKYAIVIPRYLPEMVGGAEMLLKGYAVQLAERGYDIEILTTTTLHIYPWENHFEAGVTEEDGLLIRRFEVDTTDVALYFHLLGTYHANPKEFPYHQEQQLWQNHINSTALCEYVIEHRDDYRGILVGPYPLGISLAAAEAAGPDKAIWVPCIHDEWLVYSPLIREAMERGRGILFNTDTEESFSRDVLKIVNPLAEVVGVGLPVDPPHGDGQRFRDRHNLHGPIIVYAGRGVAEKNVPLLLDYAKRYHHEVDSRVRLVLVGNNLLSLEGHDDDTYYAGELSREELYDAFAAADVFCQPSLNESFSIVIMEAWQQHRPVMVHGDCAVTRNHIERSGGGWTFTDFESFKEVLSIVFNQPQEAQAAAERGFNYVQERYLWPTITDRLEEALARITAPRPLVEELRQRGVRRSMLFSRDHFEARFEKLLEPYATIQPPLPLGQLLNDLYQQASIGLPEYQIQSGVPVVGDVIAWLRRNSTSHIKEPYFDPIIQQQTAFNHLLINQLKTIIEHSMQRQYQLERRVRQLEAALEFARRDSE